MPTRPDGRPARGLGQEEMVARTRALVARIAGDAAAAAAAEESFRGQFSLRLPVESLPGVFPLLRDDAELAFEMMLDVTCVHFPRRPAPLGEFEVVYHLLSLSKGHRLRLKVSCLDPEAGVPSATPTWPGASYMEREAYDMFGVRFTGHPDLRRILMAEDFQGWPMRKDFPYRGH